MRSLWRLGLFAALAVFLFPAAALAGPRAIPHGPPPFGKFDKAACPSVAGRPHCLALVVTKSKGGPALVSNLPMGYGPADLQTAYNLTSLSATGGAGATVAIVDAFDDPVAESDMAVYRSTYGLPPCTSGSGCFTKVNENGNPSPLPPVDFGWSDEISLDLDMVSAIAPNAKILLVEGNVPSFLDLATAVDTAASMGATQISNSYGGDEAGGASFAGDYNHPGVAITASTGDSGYYGDSNDANTPASYNTVEAVGGTSLISTSPLLESAWSGAGSGCSTLFSKQSWQTDPGCPKRMAADVSAVADPFTGVAVYDSNPDIGGWAVFGGTSASAPILAGFDALVGPATADPSWPYANVGVWNDVTSGSNGTCAISYFCNAGPGYDGPTGLGTPNGNNLTTSPPAVPSITSAPSNPTTSTSATFGFTDSTSGVSFSCSLDGAAYSACSSPKSYSGLAVGNHTFAVEATNGGGTSGPATYSWTINGSSSGPPATPVITSGPPSSTTSTSATFTFTDSTSGASFMCSLDGAAFASCSSPQSYALLALGGHTFRVEAVTSGGTSAAASASWTVTSGPPPPPPPKPQITRHPPKRTHARRATFRFKDARAGVTFQCKLDKGAWKTCKSPRAYKGVKKGKHTFAVRAKDSTGTSPVAKFVWRRL